MSRHIQPTQEVRPMFLEHDQPPESDGFLDGVLDDCPTHKKGCGKSCCGAEPVEEAEVKDVDMRCIYLSDRIDNAAAAKFIARLELLNRRSIEQHIVVYISSPGGSVSAGLAIYDAITCLPAPVITVVAGMAASMASIVAQAGEFRVMMPNARLLVHEPFFGTLFGARRKGLKQADESLTWSYERIVAILMERSKLPRETIALWLEEETMLDAKTALESCLIDGIYGWDTWLSIQGLRNKGCGGCGKKNKKVSKSKKKK